MEQRRGARPLEALERAVRDLDPIRPFTESVVGEEIAFVLRVAEADAALLAAAASAGVGGLAVPGDSVPAAFAETWLPVLHKGVLIDPYQLYESRLGGADGVVLIAEAFDGEDDRFTEMQMVAAQLGLDVVLEVADEEELEHVLDLLDPDSFLIQNVRPGRQEADFEHTFSLLEEVPAGKVVLSRGRDPQPRSGAGARERRHRCGRPRRLGAAPGHRPHARRAARRRARVAALQPKKAPDCS